MDERMASVEIEFKAFAMEVAEAPERSLALLEHVDQYDPPAAYPNRVSNVADLDLERLDRARTVFADHVPEEFNWQAAPNVFAAGYDSFLEAVEVDFASEYDCRQDFYDAVDHVLAATSPLEFDHLGVAYDLRADISAGREVDEIHDPEKFLHRYSIRPEEGRSEVSMGLAYGDPRVEATFEDTDRVEELVQESLAFTTDRLLPER